jgi:endonuclease/exonuclease/phosphatase family metal-dependent hydrolase
MTRRGALLALLFTSSLAAEALRVMTFNVRYPAKDDGENIWEKRRDLLVATIREKYPDLFGTQELFYEQGQYIVEKAPEYAWFGISRRGNQQDEHMGVFYKKARLRLAESGNFWLSENPDTPGSMSWDVSLPRMVTWGLFETATGRRRFYLYNTHFPHRGQDAQARLNCARVITDRIGRLPKDVPLIVTGDFNTGAGGEPYKILTTALKDAWETAAKRTGPQGTFNGFRGRTQGPRIDWILYRGPIRVVEAETVTKNEGGRYPSDHFPVFALLELE